MAPSLVYAQEKYAPGHPKQLNGKRILRLKSPSKLVKAGNVASAIGLRDRGAAMDSSPAFYRPPVHMSSNYLLCLTQTIELR